MRVTSSHAVQRLAHHSAEIPDGIADRLSQHNAEIEELRAEQERLRADLVVINQGGLDEEELKTALANFTEVWDELFPAEKARLVELRIPRDVNT